MGFDAQRSADPRIWRKSADVTTAIAAADLRASLEIPLLELPPVEPETDALVVAEHAPPTPSSPPWIRRQARVVAAIGYRRTRPLLLPAASRWRRYVAHGVVTQEPFPTLVARVDEIARQVIALRELVNEAPVIDDRHIIELLGAVADLVRESRDWNVGAARAHDAHIADIENQIAALIDDNRAAAQTQSEIGGRLERIEAAVQALQPRGWTQRSAPVALSDHRLLVDTAFGPVLVSDDDTQVVAALAFGGDLEKGTRLLITRLLRPGDTAIDAGAHIGTHTVVMASAVGPEGHVVAFEPHPRNAALLEATLALHSVAARVRVIEAAVGDSDGAASLHLASISGHHSLTALPQNTDTGESINVSQTRIDSVVSENAVALIKLDVEGAELSALAGAREVLAANPSACMILEFGGSHLERTQTDPDAWLRAVTEGGRDAYVIGPDTGDITPLDPRTLTGSTEINVLVAASESVVFRRLAETSHGKDEFEGPA